MAERIQCGIVRLVSSVNRATEVVGIDGVVCCVVNTVKLMIAPVLVGIMHLQNMENNQTVSSLLG